VTTGQRVPLFRLEELALAEQEPEWVLVFWPALLYGRLRDRVRRDGWWELLTVAEYESGATAREGWSTDGSPGDSETLLTYWAAGWLGFPVSLEPGEHTLRACGGLWARWHSAPLYWVRRNT
jgi:hypothetical protein